MQIISCSHGRHLGRFIAKNLKEKHSELLVKKFPDGELNVRIGCNVSKEKVVLVQSFYGCINDCIIEAVFAARTAHDLGAMEVALVAPYFPYMRQDKMFHPGEAISQNIVAGIVDCYFDCTYIMDPHLHRKDNLGDIFKTRTVRMTANELMAGYIKNNINNPVIIGPDEESHKWARNVADIMGIESLILSKKRYSSYDVKVRFKKIDDLKGKNVVIVDDIVSTGHTILETAKSLKKNRVKKIYCICVHGIFAGDALTRLLNAGIIVV